jgi:magnesium transporter
MNARPLQAVLALNQRYLLDYPHEAARHLETLPPEEIRAVLLAQPPHAVVGAWQRLAPDVAAATLDGLPDAMARHLLSEAEPAAAAGALAQLEQSPADALLGLLPRQVATELRALLAYPENSAGRLMDPRINPLRQGLSVHDALQRLRRLRRSGLRELFVVDDDGRLSGRVEIQDLATADPASPLRDITRPLLAAAGHLDPREDVVAALEHQAITELPVVDADGRFVGVIRHAALLAAVEEETSLDVQTMVGAGRDERALSSAGFGAQAPALAADQPAHRLPRRRGGRLV